MLDIIDLKYVTETFFFWLNEGFLVFDMSKDSEEGVELVPKTVSPCTSDETYSFPLNIKYYIKSKYNDEWCLRVNGNTTILDIKNMILNDKELKGLNINSIDGIEIENDGFILNNNKSVIDYGINEHNNTIHVKLNVHDKSTTNDMYTVQIKLNGNNNTKQNNDIIKENEIITPKYNECRCRIETETKLFCICILLIMGFLGILLSNEIMKYQYYTQFTHETCINTYNYNITCNYDNNCFQICSDIIIPNKCGYNIKFNHKYNYNNCGLCSQNPNKLYTINETFNCFTLDCNSKIYLTKIPSNNIKWLIIIPLIFIICCCISYGYKNTCEEHSYRTFIIYIILCFFLLISFIIGKSWIYPNKLKQK